MLAPAEIERLVGALQAVGETYEISMTPRQAAWTKLGVAMGGIYGPRVGRIAWRRLFPAPPATGNQVEETTLQ